MSASWAIPPARLVCRAPPHAPAARWAKRPATPPGGSTTSDRTEAARLHLAIGGERPDRPFRLAVRETDQIDIRAVSGAVFVGDGFQRAEIFYQLQDLRRLLADLRGLGRIHLAVI